MRMVIMRYSTDGDSTIIETIAVAIYVASWLIFFKKNMPIKMHMSWLMSQSMWRTNNVKVAVLIIGGS